ncbi:unnamed protein product [Gordionus sp. m RMFG-2023]|uniref:RNA polymerase II subunit A C-terminal domain phosphatase-like n=1 Tax=Gordionus sp. m RMFG-2023 TaxID=3053472 RepID=UPI0030DF2281
MTNSLQKLEIRFYGFKPSTIVKCRVREKDIVLKDSIFITYRTHDASNLINLKSPITGIVDKLYFKADDKIEPNEIIAVILPGCPHPTLLKDTCAICGSAVDIDISKSEQNYVPLVHKIPELTVNKEQAIILSKADETRLLKEKRLVLIVDLDHTLIHTTNDEISSNLKDVYHYQLPNSPPVWYHTKCRPRTKEFLKNMSTYYELHICTFGARSYAHTIANIIDNDGRLFSHRILSRDEFLDPSSKTANLKALFPNDDSLVCIIDDREDVWNYAKNLIHVKPYKFFESTDDINLPQGYKQLEAKCSAKVSTSMNDSDDGLKDIVIPHYTDSHEPDNPDIIMLEAPQKSPLIGTTKCKNHENDKEVPIIKESIVEPAISITNQDIAQDSDLYINLTNVVSKRKEDIKKLHCGSTETDDLNAGVPVMDMTMEEWEDSDDYLYYLEDILIRIHKRFFSKYNGIQKMSPSTYIDVDEKLPSLKYIIPDIRKEILSGVSIVFSGVFPKHIPLAHSKERKMAISLGATVTSEIAPNVTTHLIAAIKGTNKVHKAKKLGNISIVNQEWLTSCYERWERSSEKLFSLREDVLLPDKTQEARSSTDFDHTGDKTVTLFPWKLIPIDLEKRPPRTGSYNTRALKSRGNLAIYPVTDAKIKSPNNSLATESVYFYDKITGKKVKRSRAPEFSQGGWRNNHRNSFGTNFDGHFPPQREKSSQQQNTAAFDESILFGSLSAELIQNMEDEIKDALSEDDDEEVVSYDQGDNIQLNTLVNKREVDTPGEDTFLRKEELKRLKRI